MYSIIKQPNNTIALVSDNYEPRIKDVNTPWRKAQGFEEIESFENYDDAKLLYDNMQLAWELGRDYGMVNANMDWESEKLLLKEPRDWLISGRNIEDIMARLQNYGAANIESRDRDGISRVSFVFDGKNYIAEANINNSMVVWVINTN
jgi:hypothetical protein